MTSIQFELTTDDFVEFNHFHHNHSPELRRQRMMTQVGIPLIMTLALLTTPFFMQRGDPSYLTRLATMKWFFIAPPFIYFYAPVAWKRKRAALIRRMLREGSTQSLLGQCTVALNDRSITVQRPSSFSTYACEVIERISVTSDYCFIYVSAVSAIIIPKRAFESVSAFEEFVRAVTRLSLQPLTQKSDR